jgi:hypothetical protein
MNERQKPWRYDPEEGRCKWERWRESDFENHRVDFPVPTSIPLLEK